MTSRSRKRYEVATSVDINTLRDGASYQMVFDTMYTNGRGLRTNMIPARLNESSIDISRIAHRVHINGHRQMIRSDPMESFAADDMTHMYFAFNLHENDWIALLPTVATATAKLILNLKQPREICSALIAPNSAQFMKITRMDRATLKLMWPSNELPPRSASDEEFEAWASGKLQYKLQDQNDADGDQCIFFAEESTVDVERHITGVLFRTTPKTVAERLTTTLLV